jgi:DNA-binding NarL/FixJ family response regulator
MITIVIADDHPVVREGLIALIGSVPGLSVVADVDNGVAAVAAAREHRPDVVLMDLQMADSGIDATRQITATVPETRVLVLTMFEDERSVLAAMLAGARGYLIKGATQREIRQAIEAVASGGVLLSASVANRIVARLSAPPAVPDGSITPPADGRAAADAFPALTPREREVLDLIADGANNAAIAVTLHLSVKTVANHVSNILTKLQAADRSEAIVRARRAGLGKQ